MHFSEFVAIVFLLMKKCLGNVCESISANYYGQFYSRTKDGLETHLNLNSNCTYSMTKFRRISGDGTSQKLNQFKELEYFSEISKIDNDDDIVVVFSELENKCKSCYGLLAHSYNILEFMQGTCGDAIATLNDAHCRLESVQNAETFFRKDYVPQKCNQNHLYRGYFGFSYGRKDSGGDGAMCYSPGSRLKICPKIGSLFSAIDERLIIEYKKCDNQAFSENKKYHFNCLGSWLKPDGTGIFTALADANVGKDEFDKKFNCLLSSPDSPDIITFSTMATCSNVQSASIGVEKLHLLKEFPIVLETKCYFPKSFHGTWISLRESAHRFVINKTHIVEDVSVSSGHTWSLVMAHSCWAIMGNKFLVQTVIQGHCAVTFRCIEFDESVSGNGVLLYRKGRPRGEIDSSIINYNVMIEACAWSEFEFPTANSADQWSYNVLAAIPSLGTKCPFSGRFLIHQQSILNDTGLRPRLKSAYTDELFSIGWPYICPDSAKKDILSSCGTLNPKALIINIDFCVELNAEGSDLNADEMIDYSLDCIKYFRENSKSFLITHDQDEAMSLRYRCWEYERVSINTIIMKRCLTGCCERSFFEREEYDLILTLIEDERIHDNCPISFDDGLNELGSSYKRKKFNVEVVE